MVIKRLDPIQPFPDVPLVTGKVWGCPCDVCQVVWRGIWFGDLFDPNEGWSYPRKGLPSKIIRGKTGRLIRYGFEW